MSEKFSKVLANKAKQQLKRNQEFDDEITEIFMIHFMDSNEMPYGAQKARNDDPYNWTSNKLGQMPDAEIVELIDTLTESKDFASLKSIFEHSNLKEGMSEIQINKTLDKIDEDLNRLFRLTQDTSVLFKSFVDAGGDGAILKELNKLMKSAIDLPSDAMRSISSS